MVRFSAEVRGFCRLQTIRIGSVVHLTSYSVGTGCAFRRKATGTWSWPLTPTWRRGYEWVERYLHFTYMPSWLAQEEFNLPLLSRNLEGDLSWNSVVFFLLSFLKNATCYSAQPIRVKNQRNESASCYNRVALFAVFRLGIDVATAAFCHSKRTASADCIWRCSRCVPQSHGFAALAEP